MWIKSVDNDVWINMNHITHFAITQIPDSYDESYIAEAYLDTSKMAITTPRQGFAQDQARERVYQGTSQECEEFIKEQLFLQSAWQWIGYLVAGGVGAVLTLIFT